jgi:hypothetical protein
VAPSLELLGRVDAEAARARANGNEPLKQQSSSTTIRRERVRPIWTQSEVCGPAPTSLESPFRKSQSAVCLIGGR